jgi:thiamine biosynthesis lipoprotein
MGSDAHVIVVADDGEAARLDAAVARIVQLELRWSRFLPHSEVSRLNAHAGSAVSVSPDTVLLVRRATEAWRLSGGACDPTVLDAVLRAGYDRSFEQLQAASARPEICALDPVIRGELHRFREGGGERARLLGVGPADIEVDGTSVRLPDGSGFDPGGIGKGLAADVVAAELIAEGALGVCINLGGDVRVAGCGPDGGAWTVAVEHPHVGAPLVRLGLADGAVATSTTLRRRWTSDGQERHHLIDPRSGLPAETDVDLATVVAAEAWLAEALTKSVILRRAATAFDVVEGTAAEALAVDRDGRVSATPGLAAFLGGAEPPATIHAAA